MIITLASLYAQDGATIERAFAHLTPSALTSLETSLGGASTSTYRMIGCALLRRKVHSLLDKARGFGNMAEGLSHELPQQLQERCVALYGGPAPVTWQDSLDRLEVLSGGSRERLWASVVAHPMTEYVPNQCHHCGHRVPDETTPGHSDAEVGLREVVPTEAERPLVRCGYYRGPRQAVVFELDCPACGHRSRWFRSSAAQVTLNPHRWGRLCGEQEDLRHALARHLRVPLRAVLPLDWDHVWSETRREADGAWVPCEGPGDAPAANFAGRLDEGLGAWTRVLAVSADAAATEDVTEAYLASRGAGEGRADPALAKHMPRYRALVQAARTDASGGTTQAKTLNGHVLHRAGLMSYEIDAVLKHAVEEHGTKAWWEL